MNLWRVFMFVLPHFQAEKEISEEALSKAGQVANPNKIEFFARQAMKPYLVNLKTNPEAITLTGW